MTLRHAGSCPRLPPTQLKTDGAFERGFESIDQSECLRASAGCSTIYMQHDSQSYFTYLEVPV